MSSTTESTTTQAAAALAGDDNVRVVVLAGRGKSFCAGGDLGWMRAQMDAGPGTRAREATALARMLQVNGERGEVAVNEGTDLMPFIHLRAIAFMI